MIVLIVLLSIGLFVILAIRGANTPEDHARLKGAFAKGNDRIRAFFAEMSGTPMPLLDEKTPDETSSGRGVESASSNGDVTTKKRPASPEGTTPMPQPQSSTVAAQPQPDCAVTQGTPAEIQQIDTNGHTLLERALAVMGKGMPVDERRAMQAALESLVSAKQPRGREIVELLVAKDYEKAVKIALEIASDAGRHLDPIETADATARKVAARKWLDAAAVATFVDPIVAITAYKMASDFDPFDSVIWNQIGLYHYRMGSLGAAESALSKALLTAGGDAIHEGPTYANLAMLAERRSEFDKAVDLAGRALEIFNRLGEASSEVRVLGILGNVAFHRGNLDDAERTLKQALTLAEQLNLETEQAVLLDNLGNVSQTRGDLGVAEDFYARSLAIDSKLGRRDGQAAVFGNLGLIAETRGNLDAAKKYFEDAITIYKELGVETGVADNLHNLGLLFKTLGDVTAADRLIRQALEINVRLDRKANQAAQFSALGVIAYGRRDLNSAEDFHRRALAIHKELGSKEGEVIALHNLGDIAGGRGNFPLAKSLFGRALEINEQLGRKKGQANNLGKLGQVSRVTGDLNAAADFHKRAIKLNEEIGSKEGQAAELFNLGLVAEEQGDQPMQCRLWAQSRELYRQMGIAHEVDDISQRMRAAGCGR